MEERNISTQNKRTKKAERREAKAARKAANVKTEKRSQPNNIFLAVLIFGLIFGMLGFGFGHKYYQKEASIESYIAKDDSSYTDIEVDEFTKANVTAEKNDLSVKYTIKTDDKEEIKEYQDFYKEKTSIQNLQYVGASYLTSIKPETRAVFAKVNVSVDLNGDKIVDETLSYREAKKIMEEGFETEPADIIKSVVKDLSNFTESLVGEE